MIEKEPSAKYWTFWYLVVLVFLILQVVFFSLLTNYFN